MKGCLQSAGGGRECLRPESCSASRCQPKCHAIVVFFRTIGIHVCIVINFMVAGVGVLSLIAGVGVWSFILDEIYPQFMEVFMVAGVGARCHLHGSF